MRLQLVSLTGIQKDEDVYEVQLPTLAGPISVFPGHEPLVSVVVPGAIAIRTNKLDAESQIDYFAVSGGVVEIMHDLIRVLVDEADRGDDIIESESKAALEKALAMKKDAKTTVDLEKASALVDRHQVRLNVAGLRRRNRR